MILMKKPWLLAQTVMASCSCTGPRIISDIPGILLWLTRQIPPGYKSQCGEFIPPGVEVINSAANNGNVWYQKYVTVRIVDIQPLHAFIAGNQM